MTRGPRSGFSLAELLVALACAGILLAGMVQVFSASLGSWTRVNEALTVQRALRLALDRMGEDVRMAGHRFPPTEEQGPAPGAFTLLADQPIHTPAGAALAPEADWDARADELSFDLDEPLAVRAALAREVPGPMADPHHGVAVPAGEVRLRCVRTARLQPGDLLLVEDDPVEVARVAGPVRIPAGRTGTVAVVSGFGRPHQAGRAVQLLRPRQVVRYAVVGLTLPFGSGEPVPCLVRFQARRPADGSEPPWDGLLRRRKGLEGSWEVVAERVSGFRVDFAPDGLFPGIRGGTPGPAGCRAPGALFSLWLETRAPMARTGYGLPGAPRRRRWLRRSLGLLAAPGNCCVGTGLEDDG